MPVELHLWGQQAQRVACPDHATKGLIISTSGAAQCAKCAHRVQLTVPEYADVVCEVASQLASMAFTLADKVKPALTPMRVVPAPVPEPLQSLQDALGDGGVVMGLDDPAALHEAIARAVGE